jgi:hypothetical protein
MQSLEKSNEGFESSALKARAMKEPNKLTRKLTKDEECSELRVGGT